MLKTDRNTFLLKGSGYILLGAEERELAAFDVEISGDLSRGAGYLLSSHKAAQFAEGEDEIIINFAPERYWRAIVERVVDTRIDIAIIDQGVGESSDCV